MVISSLARVFHNSYLLGLKIFRIKGIRVFEENQNQITIRSGYLEKIYNHRTTGLGYFKNPQRIIGSHERTEKTPNGFLGSYLAAFYKLKTMVIY
jgi:hypothetical protein